MSQAPTIVDALRMTVDFAGAEFVSIQDAIPPCPYLLFFKYKGDQLAVPFNPDSFIASQLAEKIVERIEKHKRVKAHKKILIPVTELESWMGALSGVIAKMEEYSRGE
jgi:hypothetical protein